MIGRKNGASPAHEGVRASGAAVPLASFEAGPVRVEVIRAPGSQALQMTARVAERDEEIVVSADTPDLVLACSRAHAFAIELQRKLEDGEGDVQQLVQQPTYGLLLDAVAPQFKDAPNYRTAMRAWMEYRGYEPTTVIGTDFSAELDEHLEGFRSALHKSGKASSTINSYVSRLRKLGGVVAELTLATGVLPRFAAALRAGLAAARMSQRAFARALGVHPGTVILWCTGKRHPRHRAELVPRMEELLGMCEGELTKHLVLQPKAIKHERKEFRPFAARLQELIAARGISRRDVARAIGMSPQTFACWVDGVFEPKARLRERILPALEKYFELESESLIELLDPVPIDQRPYRWKLTPEQIAEWNRLVEHKTNKTQLNSDRKPNEYWKKTGKGCGSATYYLTTLQRYFGFLTLPSTAADELMRGRGRDGATLSLCDLARHEDIFEFVQFIARRSCVGRPDIVYNSQALTVLRFVCSLVRPRTGYLWQGHGVPWHLFPSHALLLEAGEKPDGSFGQWRLHCSRLQTKLTDVLKDLSDNEDHLIAPTRDYKHIKDILGMDRPIDALCLLFRRMEKDYTARANRVGARRRAVMARNLLLIAMIIRNPLRREHWMLMTYREDGTGNLRRRQDGSWILFIPKEDFKSLAGFRQQDYEAVIDSEIYPMIEDYLATHRRNLVGAGECDLVFLSMSKPKGGEE